MNNLKNQDPKADTKHTGSDRNYAFVDEPYTAILSKCEYLDKLFWKTKEGGHVSHEERIYFANVFRRFPDGESWLLENFFSRLSDYDVKTTMYQLNSLNGYPTLCATMCKKRCEAIEKHGGNSPVVFACPQIKGKANATGESLGETMQVQAQNRLVFPKEVLTGVAGGFANLYFQYMEAPRSFLYMVFLDFLGNLIADRITLESEICPQPRLFIILVAESADDRKSTAINQAIRFFKEYIQEGVAICYGVGSAEGLAKELNTNPKMVLCYDEFKAFVQKARIEGSVLLPCVNTLFESNFYHSSTSKHTINLSDVYLSLVAASTYETFMTMFTPQFLDIGFINRLFLVLDHAERRFALPPTIPKMEKDQVAKDLAEILKKATSLANGKFYQMPIEPIAFKQFEDWYLNSPRSMFSKRLDAYGHRLMPLVALNDGKERVDEETVQKVIALLKYQLAVREVSTPIDAISTIAGLEERMRRTIKQGRISKRDLERTLNKSRYGNWVWNNALGNLIQAKEVNWNSRDKTYE